MAPTQPRHRRYRPQGGAKSYHYGGAAAHRRAMHRSGTVSTHRGNAAALFPYNIPIVPHSNRVSKYHTSLPTHGISSQSTSHTASIVANHNATNHDYSEHAMNSIAKRINREVKGMRHAERLISDKSWKLYHDAFKVRRRICREWVMDNCTDGRIDKHVRQELLHHFGRKQNDQPASGDLSKHAYEALDLMEFEIGTDLQWGKNNAFLVADTMPEFEKIIDKKLQTEVLVGPGPVSEGDCESFLADEERCKGSVVGDWGATPQHVRLAMDFEE